MNWRNSAERYGTLSIGLHWLMLLLLGGVYACINLSDLFPKDSELRAALKLRDEGQHAPANAAGAALSRQGTRLSFEYSP